MLDAVEIKRIRKALDLTPTEFAARCKVSASTVCLWEKGDRHPRWDAMVLLNKLSQEAAALANGTNGHARKRATVATS